MRDCHFPKSRIPARGIRQREQKWQLEHKFGGHLTTAWVGWAVRRDPPLRHENRDVDGEFQLRDFEAGGYFGFSPRLRSDVFDLPVGRRRQTSQQIARVGERFHAASATAFDDGVEYDATVSGLGIAEKQPVLLFMESFPYPFMAGQKGTP